MSFTRITWKLLAFPASYNRASAAFKAGYIAFGLNTERNILLLLTKAAALKCLNLPPLFVNRFFFRYCGPT
jgi:hypothetical protein